MHKVFHSRRKSSFKKIRKEKTRAIYCKQLIKNHTRTQSKENLSTKIVSHGYPILKEKKKISNFYRCTIRSKRPKETRDATNAESTRERELFIKENQASTRRTAEQQVFITLNRNLSPEKL